ncbi:uncharacterized protein LOC132176600 [Corylus avellana]|uniref:uncharacterized protein LOC132176600 n=1 Tax=Corylus avellana TaxID=13451 RepID=UPI00286A1138|nr:uncharacterized protein LOC132176600 [Corylus avellana]
MGFQYIKDWKQLATTDFGVVIMGNEIDKIELEFLESCADQNNLSMMKNYLNAAQRHQSVGGEIICARKILDSHLHSKSSKYVWEDNFVSNLLKHSERKIATNQISVETLVCFWNLWKDKIGNIIEFLRCPETQAVKEYVDFCLIFFGVRKQFHNDKVIYLLLNPEADWVKQLDHRFIHRNGKLVSINFYQFVSTARSYWCSELLSVGMKVLGSVEALYDLSLKNSLSMFCQSISLTRIYEVAKSLLESKYLDLRDHDNKTLRQYVELSTNIFGYIFPLDWQISLAENMFSLRGTEVMKNLLKQVIHQNISSTGRLTYGQIGRVVMVILGLGKLDNDLLKEIFDRFDGIHENSSWKTFIQTVCVDMGSKFPLGTVPNNSSESPRVLSLLLTLKEALVNTYRADWMNEEDYMSPGCFLHLVEHLLILVSCFQGYFITSKSSFAEWFIYQEGDTSPDSTSVVEVQPLLGNIYDFVVHEVVMRLINDKEGTMKWIEMSRINAKVYYPLLVLRLVAIVCLAQLNYGNYSYLLFDLLHRSYITEQLPSDFYDVLGRRLDHLNNVNVIAEAFKKINNPLVIVSLGKTCSQFLCPDAIFVDMTVKQCREDIVRVLFPKTVKALQGQTGIIQVETTNSCSEVLSSCNDDQEGCELVPSNFVLNNINGSKLPMNCSYFWEMLEALKSLENGRDPKSFFPNAQVIKVDVDKSILLVSTSLQNTIYLDDESLLQEVSCMLDELKLLSAALGVSEPELEKNTSTIGELSKRLLSRRPNVEPILSQQFLQQGINILVETSETRSTSVDQDNEDKLKAFIRN